MAAKSVSTENLTVIPSAANNSFGRTLTRSAQIYGFDPHSTTSTSTSTDDDNQTTTTQSGQISVKMNYKSRQVAPSEAYLNLCANQIYVNTTNFDGEVNKVEYFEGAGDARMHATAPLFETDKFGKVRFITKATPV